MSTASAFRVCCALADAAAMEAVDGQSHWPPNGRLICCIAVRSRARGCRDPCGVCVAACALCELGWVAGMWRTSWLVPAYGCITVVHQRRARALRARVHNSVSWGFFLSSDGELAPLARLRRDEEHARTSAAGSWLPRSTSTALAASAAAAGTSGTCWASINLSSRRFGCDHLDCRRERKMDFRII